jgi:hypothetical protein
MGAFPSDRRRSTQTFLQYEPASRVSRIYEGD